MPRPVELLPAKRIPPFKRAVVPFVSDFLQHTVKPVVYQAGASLLLRAAAWRFDIKTGVIAGQI